MASIFCTECCQAASQVYDQILQLPSTINRAYNSIGRKIERITNKNSNIPPLIKSIVQQTYWGLPYTVSFALCPFPIDLIAAFGLNICAREVKEHLGKPMAERLFLGTRNFCVLLSAKYTMQSVLFPPFAMTAVTYIFLSVYSHSNAYK